MPKQVDPLDRKENITFRLKRKTILRLKKISNYNNLVESLIQNYYNYVDKCKKEE